MAKKKANTFRHILTQLVADMIEKSGNKPLNYKQVAAKLNLVDPDARTAIRDILEEGVRTGTFQEVDKGRYRLKELKVFVVGRVDMTADGSAFVVPEDEFEDDIYIAPRKLRQALAKFQRARASTREALRPPASDSGDPS